ncbi:MAG: hypothetical protein K6L75_15680 [Cellvibrionaceae bacterium]
MKNTKWESTLLQLIKKICLILVFGALIASCGGGGGGGAQTPPPPPSPPADVTAPVLSVDFPESGSTFIYPVVIRSPNDIAEVLMRGSVSDNVKVTELMVNNVSTNYTSGASVFEVKVPLTFGVNNLSVKALDAAGNESTSVEFTVINEGLWFEQSSSVLFDESNNRLLVGALLSGSNYIVSVDIATNEKRFLDVGVFTGGDIITPVPFLIDYNPIADELLFIDDGGELSRLDMKTGNKTAISSLKAGSGSSGTGFKIYQLYDADYDENNNLVYIYASYYGSSGQENAIFRVDLNNGAREVISSESIGGGESLFFGLGGIAYDKMNNRLYVATAFRLMEVNLATGERTAVSDVNTGAGPIIYGAYRTLELDPLHSMAYLTFQPTGGGGEYQTLTVDLNNGNRTLISDDSIPLTGSSIGIPVQGSTIDTDERKLYFISSSMKAPIELDIVSGKRRLLAPDLGLGPKVQYPAKGEYYEPTNALYVAEIKGRTITKVDLDSGVRTTVSGGGVGNGVDFGGPASLTIVNNTIYVGDAGASAIFEVDIVTGNRTILSDSTHGNGQDFIRLSDMAYDPVGQRLIVLDTRLDAVMSVDINNGNREILFNGMGNGFSVDSKAHSLSANLAGDTIYIAGRDSNSNAIRGVLTGCDLNDFTCDPIIDLASGELNQLASITEFSLMNDDTEIVFEHYNNSSLKVYEFASGSFQTIAYRWKPSGLRVGGFERSAIPDQIFFLDEVTGSLGKLNFYNRLSNSKLDVDMTIISQ